jgi:hypothetical protein
VRLVLAALALTLVPAAQAAPNVSVSVPSSVSGLHTDGTFLVWTDPATNSIRARRVASDLTEEWLVTTQAQVNDGASAVATHNGVVAWFEGQNGQRVLKAQSLVGQTTSVVAEGASIYGVSLNTDRVTWWEQLPIPGNAVLWGKRWFTGEAPQRLAEQPFTPYPKSRTLASENWIAWAVVRNVMKQTYFWDLYLLPASGGQPRLVADLGTKALFDLTADRLSYIDSGGMLVVQNLATNTVTTSGPHCSSQPGPSGNSTSCAEISSLSSTWDFVYWIKNGDLWVYHPATNSAYLTVAGILRKGNATANAALAARGQFVAWLSADTPTSQRLNISLVEQTLPTAPLAADDPRRQGRGFFVETGHSLGGAFQRFWGRNGGTPVFGFALTEEFLQGIPGEGQTYTVQILERQRFEYHPEHAGTPYEVQLGRLGAEALARQGIDWQTLPKADPRSAHYYAQTGQAIAPEFWQHWRMHGLELGDRGVSEREALALWGYPISPLMEMPGPDGKPIKMQVFERARLEYHPANPEPYKVLGGRLAADWLNQIGWK